VFSSLLRFKPLNHFSSSKICSFGTVLQHFIFIADAMTYKEGDHEFTLWNEQDGMYYDAIDFGNGYSMQLPVRSLVGLIPLYATLVLEPAVINRFPGFKKRMEWFIDNRTDMANRNMANMKGGLYTRSVYCLISVDPPDSCWQGATKTAGFGQQGPVDQDPGEDARRG